MALILVGGGARSGKSRYALALAQLHGRRLAFVATAQAGDDEMRARIENHRLERDRSFVTLEEPFEVASLLERRGKHFDAFVIDCLTLWVSNHMLAGKLDLADEVDRLVNAAAGARAGVVFVTNEVGCGIVPENELARRYRDEVGRLNQRVAEVAERVYWMAFGCPMRVK
ncbi:MAG: bifunctional adenosylcobinamide kinase/adenosylcobinamide-phosphate guanylyltransferase [Bryobacteraceae bacterium]|nr:bifunctional adenosylcobinamide kinase/adenosylcobinamide-phosphate guanylyltransferase [Bryobacteraceae bacterium]